MGRTGGNIADIGLPILGAIIGAPGGPAGMAAGASLGSGGASAIKGRPLGKSLKRAAITGGTTFAGGHLDKALRGAGGVAGSIPKGTGSVGATGGTTAGRPVPTRLGIPPAKGFDLSPRLLQDGNILNPSGTRPKPPTGEATKFGLNEASQVANIAGGLQGLTQPLAQGPQPLPRPQAVASNFLPPPIPQQQLTPQQLAGINIFDRSRVFGRR